MKDFLKLTEKMVSLLCLLFLTNVTYGQVVITPHNIVGFQASSTDILNFDVIYASNQAVKVQFEAVLNDASGRNVVRFISGPQTLHSGANTFNPTNFNIVTTKYYNKDIARIESATKFLPSGNYSYCIFVRCIDNDEICTTVLKPELEYSGCSEFQVEPTTPLLLNYPADEAKLEITENRPNFNWIPPMPMGSDPNISYSFTLVKMLDKQTAEDAIRRNRPVYKQEGIKGISLMFPNQLSDLEEDEHYAWQVSAQIGKLQIATCEVWEFEIIKKVYSHIIHRLLAKPTGQIIHHNLFDTLFVSFHANYIITSCEELQIEVHNSIGLVTLPPSSYGMEKRGKNILYILPQYSSLMEGEVITLLVRDKKALVQYLKIQLTENTDIK